jgi:tRNA pseudouridine32 synthase/23S rRNA pseudouridine746 synthase
MQSTHADNFIVPQCDEKIQIVFQDEYILLIHKPTKLLSLSGKNPANLDSVHYRIKKNFPSALMVHRLDLGTSGIMVIALNKEISAKLNRQFSERLVNKTYIALLTGHIEKKQGIIELPIAKGEFPYQTICHQNGKTARTEYRCLSHEYFQYNGQSHHASRVIFHPHTGRTHQLRIHSQQLGHPILGCDLYSSLNGCSEHMAKRLMLHANCLEFNHPISGERIIAKCSCPF